MLVNLSQISSVRGGGQLFDHVVTGFPTSEDSEVRKSSREITKSYNGDTAAEMYSILVLLGFSVNELPSMTRYQPELLRCVFGRKGEDQLSIRSIAMV